MGIMKNDTVMKALMGLGSMGKKGRAIESSMARPSGFVGPIDISGKAKLMKRGRRRAALGGGVLALGMGASRGQGRGATGNGYMPVGTSSGGRGY